MTKATHYQGSKGPVLISGMSFPQATNSLAKLERTEPERTDEIVALKEHIADLGVQYRAKLALERADGTTSAERIAEIDAEFARLDAEAAGAA